MRDLGATPSLEATEQRGAEGASAPRVTLDSIIGHIQHCVFFTGGEAARAFGADVGFPTSLDVLTVCLITMDNGFTVVGKSAPASEENFCPEKGREFAHEDAIRQLWPLEGYLLRSQRYYASAAEQSRSQAPEPTGRTELTVYDPDRGVRVFREVG